MAFIQGSRSHFKQYFEMHNSNLNKLRILKNIAHFQNPPPMSKTHRGFYVTFLHPYTGTDTERIRIPNSYSRAFPKPISLN